MSLDTDFLCCDNFYLEDKKIKLKIEEEYQQIGLILFKSEKESDKVVVKKFKRLLGTKSKNLDKEYYMGIAGLDKSLKDFIDSSASFIYNRFLVCFYNGVEIEKTLLTPTTNEDKLLEFLEEVDKKLVLLRK